MTALLIAVGLVAWLCALLLCIGVAKAAARGDAVVKRALAEESTRRRTLARQVRKPVRRVA
jgi:hypothetical protein